MRSSFSGCRKTTSHDLGLCLPIGQPRPGAQVALIVLLCAPQRTGISRSHGDTALNAPICRPARYSLPDNNMSGPHGMFRPWDGRGKIVTPSTMLCRDVEYGGATPPR
jgi:hypothetical protein